MAREYYGGAFTSYTLLFDTPLHECDAAANTSCIPFDPSLMTPEGIAAYVAANPRSGGEVNLLSNDLKTQYSDQFSLGMRNLVLRWGQEGNTSVTLSLIRRTEERRVGQGGGRTGK